MAKSIGELSVVIGAKVDEFKRGMAEVQAGIESANKQIKKADADWRKTFGAIEKQARQTGLAMMALGGAITAGFVKAAVDTGKLGEELLNLQEKTGISVKALSELKYILSKSGGDLGDVETGMKALSNTMLAASMGTKSAQQSFAMLGLSVQQLMAMSPEERFWAVTNALAGISDESVRAAAAQDVFGKSALNLIPMIDQGTEAIAAQKVEAQQLGVSMTESQAKAAAAFDDANDKMKASLEGLRVMIGTAVMPVLEKLVGKLTDVVTRVSVWVQQNPKLVETIAKVAMVILAAGGVLYAFSAMSKAIIAINTALIIMQSLSGPSGWAIIAAGAVIATGAIIAMNNELNKTNNLMGQITTTSGGHHSNFTRGTSGTEPVAPATTPTPRTPAPGEESLEDFLRRINGDATARKILIDNGLVPSFAQGGIVPGPIGAPVPVIAHGGEAFAGVGKTFGDTIINISLGLLPGDEVTMGRFISMIKSKLGRDSRRNSFGPVNQGYFFGRSST
jgi:hypothetical protein